jgi:hypothetical protein
VHFASDFRACSSRIFPFSFLGHAHLL